MIAQHPCSSTRYALRIGRSQCPTHNKIMHNAWMITPHERLRAARKLAGYHDPATAARAMGVPEATYYGHENGSRGIGRAARRYAEFYRVSLDWLVMGKGVPRSNGGIMVVGYIGAGSEVYPIDDLSRGTGLDFVDAPMLTSRDTVGVYVKGDSMYPAFEDGDIVLYEESPVDPKHLLGRRCVIKTADGRTFVKRLRRGSSANHYHLESVNAPTLEDVELEWAAPILAVLPRR